MGERSLEKIRVCHMTSVHNRSDGRIFNKECVSLQKAGYDVYLVVADDKPDEIKNGVHICSTGLAAKNRRERMIKGARRVFRKALEIDAEVYHFHDPELLPYGYKLKKFGKKVIFDSHEDAVSQILDKKYLVFPGLVSKIFAGYQNHVIKMLDAVITVSPNLLECYRAAKGRIYMITNYPELMPEPEQIRVRDQICFTGSCRRNWGSLEIAEAMEGLDCKYLMAGPGDREHINEVISKGKGRIKHLGELDRESVFRLQAESAIGMMLCSSSQLLKNGGSLGVTKMFEYMMNGLPVICTDVPLWREVIEQYKCGICVDPFDVQSIRKAIQYILEDEERAKKMGENGRKAVEERFNWETQSEELLRVYRNVLEANM